VDILSSFVGIYSHQIHHMPNDAMLIDNAIGSEHVACRQSDFQRPPDAAAFYKADRFVRALTFIQQPRDSQTSQRHQRDLRFDVG
jgi:hypothetical protein